MKTIACIFVGIGIGSCGCGFIHSANRGASTDIVDSQKKQMYVMSFKASSYSIDSASTDIIDRIEEVWIEHQWRYTKNKAEPEESGGYQMIISFRDSLRASVSNLTIGKPPYDSFRKSSWRHLIIDMDTMYLNEVHFPIMVGNGYNYESYDSVGYVVFSPSAATDL